MHGYMLDLLMSFQVLTPLKRKALKRKHGHATQFNWDQIDVVTNLPTSEETTLLPFAYSMPHGFIAYTGLFTAIVRLDPADRITRRSLSHIGYLGCR